MKVVDTFVSLMIIQVESKLFGLEVSEDGSDSLWDL